MFAGKLGWMATVPLVAAVACGTTSSERGPATPVPRPAASVPASATDDGSVKRSVAEGGPMVRPYAVVGTIDEVDGKSVIIRSEQGQLTAVRVNEGTRIFVDGAQAPLSELRAGDPVRASYDLGHFAETIQVGAPPGASTGAAGSRPDTRR